LYGSYRRHKSNPDAIAGAQATTDCLVKTGKIPPHVVVAVHRLLLSPPNHAMMDRHFDALSSSSFSTTRPWLNSLRGRGSGDDQRSPKGPGSARAVRAAGAKGSGGRRRRLARVKRNSRRAPCSGLQPRSPSPRRTSRGRALANGFRHAVCCGVAVDADGDPWAPPL
jgi:hypothetical protein